MPDLTRTTFDDAHTVAEHAGGSARIEIADLDGVTVTRATMQPGWRWSEHAAPQAGTGSCPKEHVGYMVAGRLGVRLDDGRELELAAGEAFRIPPGHDAWVIGEEAVVHVDFAVGASR